MNLEEEIRGDIREKLQNFQCLLDQLEGDNDYNSVKELIGICRKSITELSNYSIPSNDPKDCINLNRRDRILINVLLDNHKTNLTGLLDDDLLKGSVLENTKDGIYCIKRDINNIDAIRCKIEL